MREAAAAELRVAVHHHPRLPATRFLQLVAARASLPMPRSPGVPQVVKAKVGQLRSLHRFEPRRIADSPASHLPLTDFFGTAFYASRCSMYGDSAMSVLSFGRSFCEVTATGSPLSGLSLPAAPWWLCHVDRLWPRRLLQFGDGRRKTAFQILIGGIENPPLGVIPEPLVG